MMDTKPIKPKLHGIIDYAYSGLQVAAPAALGINSTACKSYQALGAGIILLNTLTNTPVGVKPKVNFKNHQKADAVFLAGLALLTFTKPIYKERKALVFHLGMLSLAAANYVLTDYEKKPRTLYRKIVKKITGS